MHRRSRPLVAAAAALLLAPVLTALMSAPAHAAECSRSQHREIDTPGYNADLWVKVCASGGHTKHSAFLVARWDDAGGGANDGDRKFDGLRLHLRVERNNRTYKSASWSIAGRVNRADSGVWSSPTLTATSSRNHGWTGDGYVSYDVDRDGKGTYDWSLSGSPSQL